MEDEETVVFEKEVLVTDVWEKELEEEVDMEKPMDGHMTARNSSISISPSPLTSPNLKMASTSDLLSLLPPSMAELISCLLSKPSPLTSISLNTTAVAEGHMTAMNSSISIAPSPLASPMLKI